MTDVILESIRAAVLLVIVVFLIRNDPGRSTAARRGLNFIIAGFGLLLFGSLLDITDNFESLDFLVVVGDTQVEAFLEKMVGFLGGFVVIAVGLMLWIPSIRRLDSEVSKRKQAEVALRESEASLARAQRQARIGSWRWSVEHDALVSWSEEYARIHGAREDEIQELMARQMERVIHPDDRDRVEAEFKHFDQEGTAYEIEYRIVRPDGEVRHVLEIGEPMQHGDGRVVEQTGTVQDITERKQAEEALRENEALLKQAAQMARTGHWVWDVVGNRYSYCSDELAALRGKTVEAYLAEFGTHEAIVARIHPEDRARYDQEITRADAERQAYDLEIREIAPDGELRFYRERGEPVLDERGNLIATIGMTQDVTEQKRAEEALRRARDDLELRVEARTVELRESESLFAMAFHASPSLFAITRPDDGLHYDVNETWTKTLGYTREEALAHSALDLEIWVNPRERTRFVEQVKKDGSVRGFEAKFRTKSAEELDLLVSGEYVEIGGEPRLFVVGHDITERKRTEERLIQAQRMEAIGQLTGGVAHDFNNLLGVVIGNVELLAEEIGQDESHVHSILQAALRGAELTERLLSFSRQHPLAAQTFEAGALIEKMTALLCRTLGETIELKLAVAPDLWIIRADPGQLETALLNLALNARDAMPEGGKLTIEAANATLDEDYVADHIGAPRGDYVVLAVSDNGVGMPPKTREHAFEPFFTTKVAGEGSGLGLSMVYGFAKQSGGHIMIYSEEGHGTVVKVYLPRAAVNAEQAQGAADDETPGGRGETILLVEDDPALRELAVSTLTSLGYGVRQAENGKTALAALEASPEVDLLLSDVVLPGGKNGFELAHEAVARRGDLKVLFMSGYAENAVRHNGALEPAHEVLGTPFRRRELAKKLRALLDR